MGGPLGLCWHLAAGDSLGCPLLAASAAEESPPPKRAHIAYLSEVKEESSGIQTQVAMVTEEDGAPQVALITQDGTQQVEALGTGGAISEWPLMFSLQRAVAEGTSLSAKPCPSQSPHLSDMPVLLVSV